MSNYQARQNRILKATNKSLSTDILSLNDKIDIAHRVTRQCHDRIDLLTQTMNSERTGRYLMAGEAKIHRVVIGMQSPTEKKPGEWESAIIPLMTDLATELLASGAISIDFREAPVPGMTNVTLRANFIRPDISTKPTVLVKGEITSPLQSVGPSETATVDATGP
jgi:hypothetical protein